VVLAVPHRHLVSSQPGCRPAARRRRGSARSRLNTIGVPEDRATPGIAAATTGYAVTHVVITGGAGFLGSRLAGQLLRRGTIEAGGGPATPLSRLTIVDQASPPADLAADERVRLLRGSISDLLGAGGTGQAALAGAEVIFHLAAAVSGECEADFDLGIRANLRGTEALLASCRALGSRPVVVFASSVAVFGGSAECRLPPVVDDHTMPNPQTSYGVQKVIGEQLLADYTRKGFLRGRAIRLMTVTVRPGAPNGAASGFLSGIIREPLAGRPAVCPVGQQTEVAITSPDKAVAALTRAAAASDQEWGGRTAVTMPGLTVTVGGMTAALERAAGPQAAALIDWSPQPHLAGIVTGWPARFRTDRAARLGLTPDPDFDTVISQYVAGQHGTPPGSGGHAAS
jgi:nucleoside-diphosphate-sugar epimerase